tara:strand:+ start:88 stop:561 length:474 start_codon:yes stop_codon:yes gene_type:complete
MQKSGKNVIWDSDEVIYEVDSEAGAIFIIVSGSVNIYSRDGLLLNTIRENELLGETSTILNIKRSITAKAGPSGAAAIYINKPNLRSLLKKNTALAAIIEKTQLRLMDSNKQSEDLSNLLNNMIKKIDEGERAIGDLRSLVEDAKSRLSSLVNSNLD